MKKKLKIIEYLFVIAQVSILIFGCWKATLSNNTSESVNIVVITALCGFIITMIGIGILDKINRKDNEKSKIK